MAHIAKCFMNSSRFQYEVMFEKEELALLVSTPCWHLHNSCKTANSSSLGSRVTLTQVSQGKLGEFIKKETVSDLTSVL
jgi:hypothetical protein